MVAVLKKVVNMPFQEAVAFVKTKMEEEGFNILLVKSIAQSIREKLNITNFEECTIILGCNPEIAYEVLSIKKSILTLFPCSFVVYEEKNKVMVAHISIMKIAKALNIITDDRIEAVISKTSQATESIWSALL